MKILRDGTTGHHWRHAKGKKAVNQAECSAAYARWWRAYIDENPDLLALIRNASGLSDQFASPGSTNQASVLWSIRNQTP